MNNRYIPWFPFYYFLKYSIVGFRIVGRSDPGVISKESTLQIYYAPIYFSGLIPFNDTAEYVRRMLDLGKQRNSEECPDITEKTCCSLI